MTKLNVDYFIKKFKGIPRSKWTTGAFRYQGKCCALGHCGADYYQGETLESRALKSILGSVISINDGKLQRYPQKTPKGRILAALNRKKKGLTV